MEKLIPPKETVKQVRKIHAKMLKYWCFNLRGAFLHPELKSSLLTDSGVYIPACAWQAIWSAFIWTACHFLKETAEGACSPLLILRKRILALVGRCWSSPICSWLNSGGEGKGQRRSLCGSTSGNSSWGTDAGGQKGRMGIAWVRQQKVNLAMKSY